MAQKQVSRKNSELQEIFLNDSDFLKEVVRTALQKFLDNEMSEHLSAVPYERSEERSGYRNGSYGRILKTRVGRIELEVPRDRDGTFQTAIFERYQRCEKALLLALMEMTIQGVSTRKVRKITEELCGTTFSASMVSSLCSELDAELESWRNRPLEGEWPYLFVDAVYHKVRYNKKVVSMAVAVVTGVNLEGRRSVLGIEVFHSENGADYSLLFRDLQKRGLKGVQLVISDDHKGMRQAIDSNFPGVSWQRCQVHFMRNFLSRLRKKDRGWALAALKDVFAAPDREQAETRLKAMILRLQESDLELADWLEENAPETLSVFSFPEGHRCRIKSTNSLERLNEEIRRRTRVIRIFPHRQSCVRMITSLCLEKDEEWTTGKQYLNMELLSKNNIDEKTIKNIRIAG
ncbi:MAG: IS256 family transposase [Bacteroidetes bacterium]|nr:IS256 family transposase [Bacteroidota bacterium]